jgi:hypothetical protein
VKEKGFENVENACYTWVWNLVCRIKGKHTGWGGLKKNRVLGGGNIWT